MLNPIEKFKVAILHLNRAWNHWSQKCCMEEHIWIDHRATVPLIYTLTRVYILGSKLFFTGRGAVCLWRTVGNFFWSPPLCIRKKMIAPLFLWDGGWYTEYIDWESQPGDPKPTLQEKSDVFILRSLLPSHQYILECCKIFWTKISVIMSGRILTLYVI